MHTVLADTGVLFFIGHPGTQANEASSGHMIMKADHGPWEAPMVSKNFQQKGYHHFYLQVIPKQVTRPCLSSEGAQTYPCPRKDHQNIVLMSVTITPQKDCSLPRLYPHLK